MRYSFLFLILLIACQAEKPKTLEEQIIDTWVDAYNSYHKIAFSKKGFFYRFNGEELLEHKFLEEQINGKYEEIDYGDLKYHLKPMSGDSISYSLLGNKNQKEFSKGIFILRGDELVEITYKTLPGIETHIDEIAHYIREGSKLKSQKEKVEKVIVPKGFNGSIHIAYNQGYWGQDLAFDSLGNRLLYVPENGVLKTKFKEDPFIMATHKYEFYEKDTITGKLRPIQTFQHGDYRSIAWKIRNPEESFEMNFKRDDMAMFVCGFNQISRGDLERGVFNQTLDGNVILFRLDTIGKILRLDHYLEKLEN